MIDVNPNYLDTVTRILAGHVPECEVRAFGSRVTWTAKDYSDLDLAVVGERALVSDTLRRLKEAFEESDLPFRVDVLDWHAISPAFRKVIEKKYEVVQKGKKKSWGMGSEELVGALPAGWEYTTLGEACARAGGDVQTGPFGSQLHAADYVSGGIPSIMPQNIGDNRVVRDGIAQVTVEDAERLNRYRVRTGDIVYSRRGDVERRALIRDAEDGWLCGTGCLRVRFGDEYVNPDYASYYFGDPKVREWIVRHAHGATMPNLNTTILSALPFVLPPLPEQRAIAHILGTLDDKIELNRRMNETLEAIARALFHSWFVAFDPVRRNMARKGRGQPSPGPSGHPLPKGEGQHRSGYDFSGLVETARALRKTQTPAEDFFWELVRDRRILGLKFRRQHQLGDYIADFYCHEHRLVVELDGGIHSAKRKKDHKRDAWMEAQGITVLRFPNAEILDNPSAPLRRIADTVSSSSRPLPLGEGRGEGSVEELDRLFPDSFEDSELGEIPRGWGVKPLPDVIEVNPPRPLRKGDVAPYLDMANMPTRGHSPDAVIDRPFGSGMRFVNGDTLVARITPCLENGKTAYVDFLPHGQVGWGSTEYIVFRPKLPLPDEFAYCLARATEFRDFAIQSMTGSSGRQRVPAESLSHFRVVAAPKPIAELFGRFIKPLFARASAATKEGRTLAALRDTLLPKLISGELRLKDVERIIPGDGA